MFASAHLPALFSLDYAEKIIMPKDLYDGLSTDELELLKTAFPHDLDEKLVLTDPVDASIHLEPPTSPLMKAVCP